MIAGGNKGPVPESPKKKRKREATKLHEEWKQMYWFRGSRMEAVLDDYGSSYDSYHNTRKSRRLAQRLLLTMTEG
jgi:hypothetical protein